MLLARLGTGAYHSTPGLGVVDMQAVPRWTTPTIPSSGTHHLHHIFPGNGADHLKLGAEVEFARGCPYSCTFCNKTCSATSTGSASYLPCWRRSTS